MKQDPRSILERLEQLERENRRARRVASIAVIGALCLPLIAWTQGGGEEPVLRASKFQLVDSEQRVRAELRMEKGGPGLYLIDAHAKARVRLSIVKDEDAGLILTDKAGRKRLGALVDEHDFPHFVLNDEAERPRAHLVTGVKGAPGLVFTAQDGTRPAGMGVDPSGKAWILPSTAPSPTAPGAAKAVESSADESKGSESKGSDSKVEKKKR